MNSANNCGSECLHAEASTSVPLKEKVVKKKKTRYMNKKKKGKKKRISKKEEKKKKKKKKERETTAMASRSNSELAICNYDSFLHLVFEYLPVRDLLNARFVCKAWHERFEPPSPTTAWLCKQLLLHKNNRLLFADLPATTSAEHWTMMYLVRKRSKKKVRRLAWDRFGTIWPSIYDRRTKYKGYVQLSHKICFFDNLVLAVRILYCLGPSKAYLKMHGIDEFAPCDPTALCEKQFLLPHWEGNMED